MAIVKWQIFLHNSAHCKRSWIICVFLRDSVFQYSGDLHWFPRDDTLRTPPGPEGSNGSSGLGRRGVAGVDRLQYISLSLFFLCLLYLTC